MIIGRCITSGQYCSALYCCSSSEFLALVEMFHKYNLLTYCVVHYCHPVYDSHSLSVLFSCFFFLIKKYVLTACLRGHVWRHQIACVHLHVACNLVFATFDAFEQTLNSSSTVWAADMNDSSGCVTCWRAVCCYFTKWSNDFHWWTIKWEKIHRLTLNRPQTNLANTQDHLRKLKTCCH